MAYVSLFLQSFIVGVMIRIAVNDTFGRRDRN